MRQWLRDQGCQGEPGAGAPQRSSRPDPARDKRAAAAWRCAGRYTDIHGLTDPRQALEAFVRLSPDVVLLDLMMPDVDGYGLLDAFRRQTALGDFRPVLVLTADATTSARRRALSLGAKDFVPKPFDVVEVALRIANLLETRVLYERFRTKVSN